jgi:hypothetical protein
MVFIMSKVGSFFFLFFFFCFLFIALFDPYFWAYLYTCLFGFCILPLLTSFFARHTDYLFPLFFFFFG